MKFEISIKLQILATIRRYNTANNDDNQLFRDYDYCPKANIVNKAFWATIKSIKSSSEVAEHL